MRRMIITLGLLAAVPTAGLLAQGQPGRPPGQQPGMQPGRQMQPGQGQSTQPGKSGPTGQPGPTGQTGPTGQETGSAGLADQMRQTNRWMEQHRVRTQYQQMGSAMEKAGEEVDKASDQANELTNDPGVRNDPGQMDALGQFQQGMRDTRDALDKAHEDLKKVVGAP